MIMLLFGMLNTKIYKKQNFTFIVKVEEDKDQESKQSSTIPEPEIHMGK